MTFGEEHGQDGLVARLSRLDSCAVSDALDLVGAGGVASGLVPLWEGARLVGRAVTVKLAPGSPPPRDSGVHLGVRAIERCTLIDVIVIDNGGRLEMGGWGGLLSLAASLKGIPGVVLDGACRDVDEARALGFAVFARGGVPRTARGRVYEQSCGEPVHVGGVTAATGDLVIADGSGVVVVPRDTAVDTLAQAERIGRREEGMVSRLRAGEPLASVMGADYETMITDPREDVSRYG